MFRSTSATEAQDETAGTAILNHMVIVSAEVRLWRAVKLAGEYRCFVFLATGGEHVTICDCDPTPASTSRLSPQLFGAQLALFSANSLNIL
jgi:hypothetical protein